MLPDTAPTDSLDAPLASVMRAQAPVHRLLGPTRSTTTPLLTLLELASRATAGQRRRCEFVVVRDPDVRHQLARSYRQGWSVYRRVLHTRAGDDALLEARQWEADHFEDVPVIVVACVHGRRPVFSAIGAAIVLLGRVPGGAEPPARRRRARPRRRGQHPRALVAAGRPAARSGSRRRSRRSWSCPLGRPRGVPTPAPVAPVGNLVHLDRYGHQPFRGRARH